MVQPFIRCRLFNIFSLLNGLGLSLVLFLMISDLLVGFEHFVRSITHYVNKLKFLYIFCFSRPIQDDPTASKVTFFRSKTTRAMRFVGRSQSGNQLEEQRTMVTSANSASRNLDNQLKTRRKVAKMLIAVVIMFSINFFPVHFLPVLNVSFLYFFQIQNMVFFFFHWDRDHPYTMYVSIRLGG